METRHPLTIPAAIVLGTAVVATAVPLPTSTPPTATATGTAHVTRAYTDKSTHEPGTQATILAEASTEGTVHFSVSHLGVEVASGDATVTNGKATWTYTTPSENNQGYLVTATGGDGTHAETAIDASTSWTRFPRMGFLSHFKPAAPEGMDGHTTYEAFLFQKPQDYTDKLSRDYHINALQYYDWQYRHEQPLATGDLENEWPLWYRDTYASKKTITDYIVTAKNANIGSLAYSMAYAANDNYDTNTIKDDWRLREDNGSYCVRDLAGGSAVTFTIDAGQGGTFTFTTRYARQDDDPAYHQMILDMGKTGQQKLIKYVHFDATGSDYTWKDMTETLELTPGTHTISFWVPNDKNYTPVNIDCITFREFNADSVKLADAAFAANGAHHLELGDYGRMLDNEFFVSSGRSMSADLQAWLKNYYNISTAYENLLFGDNLTRKERQVEVSTNGVSLPTSTDGASNTIWANTMTSNAGTALHLINLRTNDNEGNDEYWRNSAKQILPFDNTSVTYHPEDGEQVPGSIFAVSPDDDGGRPTPRDFTTGTDEQGRTTLTFNVGRLSSWDMVVFSPATYADRAALAPAAVDTSDNAAAPDADDAALVPATMVGQLENRASGLCLTIPGDTTRDATQAVISQCSDSSKSQRWTLTDTSGQ